MTPEQQKPKTMTYTHRQATPEDASAIAPLWEAFARERAVVDPSMVVKPDFDFEKYIARQLAQPLSMGWVLESNAENKTIVGCLFIYFYDEAPPPNLPADMLEENALENPFQPRRVGSVLGMYVRPEHRKQKAIELLASAGIEKAEEMKVSDIDLLVGADQTGIHALLERAAFAKAAVQYTRFIRLQPATPKPRIGYSMLKASLSLRPRCETIAAK